MTTIQEKIDLTPEQKKAFTALKKAINRCTKTGIYFYQVLESLGALNGKYIKAIRLEDDKCIGVPEQVYVDERCLNFLDYPSVDTTGSFADDDHYIQLITD